jgi:pimeloyl-ACP methyl ester carboxylesterase
MIDDPAAAPPALIPPPEVAITAASPDARFLVMGQGANLWFELGSGAGTSNAGPHARDLIISFDNLATIDEGWPRGPWAMRRLAPIGAAILGVQSHAKDWFRTPAAPDMLRALAAQGFFDSFANIVMIGASMGGFAALNFAPLVPRARVIALSAQSSMNKHIAPFEARFPFAVRKSNWDGQPFLDAAAAIAYIPAVALLFDPFTPEDAKHAARMRAPHVQQIRLDHATHEAVRVVMKAGAFQGLVQDMLAQGRVSPQFWVQYRGRRAVPKWQKSLLQTALERGHAKLVVNASNKILAMAAAAGLPDDELVFARRARREALRKIDAPAAE